jgi:hypothetical protein
MKEKNMDFANLLRAWINARYTTAAAIAVEWNIQYETVIKLLRGDLLPAIGQVPAIAKRMGYAESVVREAIDPAAKRKAELDRILSEAMAKQKDGWGYGI